MSAYTVNNVIALGVVNLNLPVAIEVATTILPL